MAKLKALFESIGIKAECSSERVATYVALVESLFDSCH